MVDEIKEDSAFFNIHVALEDEWWDNISFEYYGTSQFWYIICQINDIVNPYEELVPGQQVKVLKQSYLYEVFKNMAEISEL